MKINNIQIGFDKSDRDRAVLALLAAFSPFGSLKEGVDGETLAQKMCGWVDGTTEVQKSLAGDLLGLVWSATTDHLSTVEFGSWDLTLRTPTSGTSIKIIRAGGGYYITVDFGSNGSTSRAMQILTKAERVGVRFLALWENKEVDRHLLIDEMRRDAEGSLQCYRSTENYPENIRKGLEMSAQRDAEFFAALV